MSDASSKCVVLCPGQGAQHIGMGKAWAQASAIAAETFRAADAALGINLSHTCFEGPEDQLNRTDVAQAAIYVSSVACLRAMQQRGELGEIVAAAGLSLGEFTALHLAGAFSFEDGLQLVRKRGLYMQEAAEAAPSGMVALTGADEDSANDVCRRTLADGQDGEVLVPANFNSPGQVVISGSLSACERSVAVATDAGLRATPLKVAGAFHSPLMQPAAQRLADALEEADWKTPDATVMSNVTAEAHDRTDIASIKQRLVDQLTHPVRWAQSMTNLIALSPGGADVRYIEPAPGKVLMGLMRRIDRGARVANFAEPG